MFQSKHNNSCDIVLIKGLVFLKNKLMIYKADKKFSLSFHQVTLATRRSLFYVFFDVLILDKHLLNSLLTLLVLIFNIHLVVVSLGLIQKVLKTVYILHVFLFSFDSVVEQWLLRYCKLLLWVSFCVCACAHVWTVAIFLHEPSVSRYFRFPAGTLWFERDPPNGTATPSTAFCHFHMNTHSHTHTEADAPEIADVSSYPKLWGKCKIPQIHSVQFNSHKWRGQTLVSFTGKKSKKRTNDKLGLHRKTIGCQLSHSESVKLRTMRSSSLQITEASCWRTLRPNTHGCCWVVHALAGLTL